MDAFQATVSALSLIELCVKVAKFIKNVRQIAGDALEDLETLTHEIDSLQNVSKLVVDLAPVFKELGSQLLPEHTRLLKELDAGVLLVVQECQGFMKEIELIVDEIQRPVTGGIGDRIDAIKIVLRSNKRKGDIQRLRRNIQSGQSRLQAFYLSLNIIQVRANAVSIQGVSDEVRKLGFDLKNQIAHVASKDDQAELHGRASISRVLGTVRLNKHFDVPRTVGDFFIGRQSLLQQLKAAFDEPQKESTTSPKIFVIHGFPGSGKTDFSYKFAEQHRESFWGVFFMQADTHSIMANSFRRIATYADKKIEPSMAAAKHWLASQELPWLLIMDNADDPELDMSNYFPASANGCILITTRHRDLRRHGNVGARYFSFERLQLDEAKTVLLRAAGEPDPPRPQVDVAASQISEELHCLPLALVSAGKTIRSKLCTWKSYPEWYHRSCDRISKQLHVKDSHKEDDTARLTVISTIEPHFAQLEQVGDRVSIDALELIYTLGYFDHRNISIRLLKLVATNANKALSISGDSEDKDGDGSSASTTSPVNYKAKMVEAIACIASNRPVLPDVLRNVTTSSLDEDRLRDALNRLEKLSLIRCDEKGAENDSSNWHEYRTSAPQHIGDDSGSDFEDNEFNYSLHPLVHSWIRQRHASLWKMSVWCEAANTALAQCIVLEAKAFTTGESSHFDAREILPHIERASQYKANIDDQLRQRAVSSGWARNSLLLLRATPVDPCWLTRIGTATRLVKYSLAYRLCGEFQKAADMQTEVRSFIVSKRGMNDRVSIYITVALASTLQLLTEFGKAAALQKEVVQACRTVFGHEHPQTLTMVDNYGLLLLYHGRLKECTDSHQEAFDGFTRLGKKHLRQALIAKAHLGAVRAKYMEFAQSKIFCQEAISGLEDIDPNDEEILWAKEALALACGELNDGSNAYDLMLDVYRKRERALGKQHPFTLWATVNLSRALWRMKRFEDALETLREPREIAELTLGKRHFGFLAGEVLRACIMRDQGNHEEAQILFATIDNTYEEIKQERGVDHADRIIALGYQFELFEIQGKYRDAIRIGHRMLDALRGINAQGLGWKHPLRPRIENKIAELEAVHSSQAPQSETRSEDQLRQRRVLAQGTDIQTSLDTQAGRGLMCFH